MEIESASDGIELPVKKKGTKSISSEEEEVDDTPALSRRLDRIVRQDLDKIESLMAGQDSSLGREVGLNEFKLLVYGGLIFFVILSFPQFSFYGECRYITWEFTCSVPATAASFEGDASFRYAYTEIIDPINQEIVGMYVQAPAQCGSPGLVLPFTIPPEDFPPHLGQCLMPLGNGTYVNFTQDFYRAGRGDVVDAGIGVCRIYPMTSTLALISVILLVVAFIIDQGFGTISEEAQKIDERAARGHAISPKDENWLTQSNIYPAATVLTFATVYNFATVCVMVAHCILIAFLVVWQNDKPPAGSGCEGPGLVGTLLIILSALSIFVEFIEWVYNSYRNYLPNFVRSVDGIAGVEAVLINHIIDDHYTQALVSLEDTGTNLRPDPVLLRKLLKEMREKSKQDWLKRGDPWEVFKYFTFYRACCCCLPPLYFIVEWCSSRKNCLTKVQELEEAMTPEDYQKFMKSFNGMEKFLKKRLVAVSQKLDDGYFPETIHQPAYTFRDLRKRLVSEESLKRTI